MSLRDTLDDAADLAMAGRRVDPVVVLATVAEQDARPLLVRRRRPVLTGIAVAASLLVLIAVLVAGRTSSPSPAERPPTLGPTGLPTRLETPPPWTPLVTEHPIEAASALFADPVVHGLGSGTGLFVLSADGRDYRRLPWSGGQADGLTAISADGRWVAWVEGSPEQPLSPVLTVHVLRLRDGLHHVVRLPDRGLGGSVDLMVFRPDDSGLLVQGGMSTSDTADVSATTWRVDLRSGQAGQECSCLTALGVDRGGRLYAKAGERTSTAAGLPTFDPGGEFVNIQPVSGLPVAVSPDGRAWASGRDDTHVQVVGVGPETLLPQVPGSNPQVLGWGAAGILVAATGSPPGASSPGQTVLYWLDPRSGRTRVAMGMDQPYPSRPPRVAIQQAAGAPVPSVRPTTGWNVDRVQFYAGRGVVLLIGVLGLALIAGFPLILRRLRRRDGAVLTTANGAAGNQGRLW
jgi:hypothetical protein